MRKMKQFLCVLLALLFIPVVYVYGAEADYSYEAEYGAEIEAVTVTYEQALQMVLDNSLDLQDMYTQLRDMHIDLRDFALGIEAQFFNTRATFSTETNVARMERNITDYVRRLRSRIVEWENNRSTDYRRPGRQARHNLNEFERYIESLRLHKQQVEIAMELVLRSSIVNISELDLRIEVMQRELDLAEENLRRVTLAHELGLLSIRELNDAQHGLTQGYVSMEELVRNRDAARQDLNYLLGQPLHQYTVIEFERELMELPQDIAQHIGSVISQTFAIRQSQQELDTVLGERWVFTGNNRYIRITESERRRARTTTTHSPDGTDMARLRERIALQDAVERAETRHEQAIRTMETAIIRGFNDLEGLLALEAALERELTQALIALEVTITSFDLGRATRLDIEAARLVIFQVEQDIEKLRNSMWILTFILENPDLL